MDMGRTIYNHRPGICRQVHGPGIYTVSIWLLKTSCHVIVKGSEDIELIRSEGIAFITSGIVYMQPQRTHVEGNEYNKMIIKRQLVDYW